MSMKKFLTAILLFDLMAGLLFLGLWERESSAVTAWGNNSGISEEEGERGTEEREAEASNRDAGEASGREEREAEASGREEQGTKVQGAEVQWDGMETLNNVITGRGGEAAEEVRKIAITFEEEVIIGLSQEISYSKAIFMIQPYFYCLIGSNEFMYKKHMNIKQAVFHIV